MEQAKKPMKKSIKILLIILAIIGVAFAALGIKWAIKSQKINDDYSSVTANTQYLLPVSVPGIEPVTQEVTCGYATIEMLSNWSGKDITEESLLAENNGKITTGMGNGFKEETAKHFPEYTVEKHENLSNSEVLTCIHDSLSAGNPVPIEFASLYDDGKDRVWTMHFSLVTGMDLAAGSIEIANPYGYTETLSTEDFLRAMRFESYEDMPLYLQLAFLAEIFPRNTVYILS